LIYFSGDTFDDFMDVMTVVLNDRVQFSEEDSFIIYELTSP
jgi:hypothetical protein